VDEHGKPRQEWHRLTGSETGPALEIGILTKGKPTLSMVLISLLLQEERNIRIHVVDTSETPVINRDDVVFALKLAFDREIRCEYEYSRERQRAFSVGKLKLLETLRGPHICFVDDDIVMPSSTIARMLSLVKTGDVYGYYSPVCKNAGAMYQPFGGRTHYSPGGVFYQDSLVRNILMDYYSETVDVLDSRKAPRKVWETAFLTSLFPMLGRKCVIQDDNIVYHLDYNERAEWELWEGSQVHTSAAKAEELVAKYAPHLLSGK